MKTVKIGDFNKVVSDALKGLNRDVGVILNSESKRAAKEAVKHLKAVSPERTGAYAKSWTSRKEIVESNQQMSDVYTVYNKDKYRLTHLLEYGYVHVKSGRRVGQKAHIGKVESYIQDFYIKNVSEAIENANI